MKQGEENIVIFFETKFKNVLSDNGFILLEIIWTFSQYLKSQKSVQKILPTLFVNPPFFKPSENDGSQVRCCRCTISRSWSDFQFSPVHIFRGKPKSNFNLELMFARSIHHHFRCFSSWNENFVAINAAWRGFSPEEVQCARYIVATAINGSGGLLLEASRRRRHRVSVTKFWWLRLLGGERGEAPVALKLFSNQICASEGAVISLSGSDLWENCYFLSLGAGINSKFIKGCLLREDY